MRQGRWTGRGAFLVGSALVAAFVLISAASAQQRNNQPQPQPQPQRQRGADPVPGGFQSEAVDLNEGKSPAELFKSGCAVCHNSVAGLAKGRSDGQLVSFLRQHYTSGTQHAAALASFLAANGRGSPAATPARLNPGAPIDRPPGAIPSQEAARPQDREPAAKRKPPEKQPPVAARPAPAATPPASAAPAAPAATTEAAAHQGDTPAPSPPAPAVEEKPAPPEIPL